LASFTSANGGKETFEGVDVAGGIVRSNRAML